MKSWKTTLCGFLTALAAALVNTPDLHPALHTAGTLLGVIAPALLGYFARDNAVTSEQAGVK